MQSTHSIFIADHNQDLLDGLTNIIGQESGFKVVGTARNGKELIYKAAFCAPEVYLIDFELPQLNGIHISQYFLSSSNPAKMIMLTHHWEKSLIKKIIAMGVKGCLLKTCDADELIFAINQVLAGNTYFHGFSEDQLNDMNMHNNLLP